MRQNHETVIHKWDDRQFAALLHLLSEMLTGGNAENLNALTARLKSSGDALTAAVTQAQPAPKE